MLNIESDEAFGRLPRPPVVPPQGYFFGLSEKTQVEGLQHRQ